MCVSNIQAIIFDLDGVLLSTDKYHYIAWKALADELGIPFCEKDNEAFRGVSRMDCMEILLSKKKSRCLLISMSFYDKIKTIYTHFFHFYVFLHFRTRKGEFSR